MIEMVSKHTLESDVLYRLREAIIAGIFEPGSQLNQVQIASQFGVSRGPLRAALRILEEEGLVRNVPHHGTFVTKVDNQVISNLYGVRAVLEAYAVQLATPRCTGEDLEHLTKIVVEMQQASKEADTEKVIWNDLAVHQYLIELSGNSVLVQTWSALQVQVRRSLTYRHRGSPDLKGIADSHLPLLEMLRQKDAEGASKVLHHHIIDAGEDLLRCWQQDEEEKTV